MYLPVPSATALEQLSPHQRPLTILPAQHPVAVCTRPTGVFDSGTGGLSVLHALRQTLPREHFVYYADTAHAPYGEHSEAFIQRRCEHIVQVLIRQHRIKALVVACNTATAAAADRLRERYPQLPVIGVEPGLKPAALASRTGHTGVLATRSTLASKRFRKLLHQLSATTRTRFHLVAGVGLVQAIEDCVSTASAAARDRLSELCRQHIASFPPFGNRAGQIDQLVLGCTHYTWAEQALREAIRKQMQKQEHTRSFPSTGTASTQPADAVTIVHTAQPVARQAARILNAAALLNRQAAPGTLQLTGSGNRLALHHSAEHWLNGSHNSTNLRSGIAPTR